MESRPESALKKSVRSMCAPALRPSRVKAEKVRAGEASSPREDRPMPGGHGPGRVRSGGGGEPVPGGGRGRPDPRLVRVHRERRVPGHRHDRVVHEQHSRWRLRRDVPGASSASVRHDSPPVAPSRASSRPNRSAKQISSRAVDTTGADGFSMSVVRSHSSLPLVADTAVTDPLVRTKCTTPSTGVAEPRSARSSGIRSVFRVSGSTRRNALYGRSYPSWYSSSVGDRPADGRRAVRCGAERAPGPPVGPGPAFGRRGRRTRRPSARPGSSRSRLRRAASCRGTDGPAARRRPRPWCRVSGSLRSRGRLRAPRPRPPRRFRRPGCGRTVPLCPPGGR